MRGAFRLRGYRWLMSTELSPEKLARVLPGSWGVRATNFPEWLESAAHSQLITFTVLTTEPLSLREEVSFEVTGGESRRIDSIDRWRGNEFVRRSTKKSELASSRWTATGMSDDENVIGIRFAQSRAVPAGISILVREDTTAETRTRALVAHHTEQFGLSMEDFASLAWFGGVH
jgi:hypothetical protein